MNNAIKEFLPLVIIAFSALLVAGIVAGYLTLILIFVLFLETLLLSYLFINYLDASGTIKITFARSIIMATILTAIITSLSFQDFLLMVDIVIVAIFIILIYRDR